MCGERRACSFFDVETIEASVQRVRTASFSDKGRASCAWSPVRGAQSEIHAAAPIWVKPSYFGQGPRSGIVLVVRPPGTPCPPSFVNRPKVSIGLPVYNGQNYLRRALDSLLAQTFEDFELVICDNASTDQTESICREFAERDPRVRYHRNEANLGAAPNYNKTFHLARGDYFKWSAHDDELDPRYLEQTVAILDAQPDVVLCHSLVRIIDEQSRELSIYDSRLKRAGSSSVRARFRSLTLTPHICTEIFGLVRREPMSRTLLHGHYHGCDRALLAELSLLGGFHQIEEPLFHNREHANRYVRKVKPEERAAWAYSRATRRIGSPTWKLYREYHRAVSRLVPVRRDRLHCRLPLLEWWFTNWNLFRVGIEVLSHLHPPLHRLAARVRRRFGAEPPVPVVTDATPRPAPLEEAEARGPQA